MAGLNHKHYRFWIAVAVVATAILVVLLMRQSRSGERRALYFHRIFFRLNKTRTRNTHGSIAQRFVSRIGRINRTSGLH